MPEEIVTSGTPGATSAPAAGSSTGTSATSGTTDAAAAAASSTSTGTTSGSAAAAAARKYEYAEDRSQWVPPDRVSQIARQRRDIEQQLFLERQRVAALSGVKAPPAPEDPETAQMRRELETLYPGLKRLGDLPFDKLIKSVERLEQLEQHTQSSEQHYWSSYGRQQLNIVSGRFKEVFGKEPSDRQQRVIAGELREFCEADPRRVARYEAQDPTLIEEFWTDYTAEHIDPYRRHFTAPVAAAGRTRERLPQAGASNTVAPGQGTGKSKPKDEDEMWDQAFDSFEKSRAA